MLDGLGAVCVFVGVHVRAYVCMVRVCMCGHGCGCMLVSIGLHTYVKVTQRSTVRSGGSEVGRILVG